MLKHIACIAALLLLALFGLIQLFIRKRKPS